MSCLTNTDTLTLATSDGYSQQGTSELCHYDSGMSAHTGRTGSTPGAAKAINKNHGEVGSVRNDLLSI